jgi:vacuolar-type H+-ATPase subunit H
MPETALLSLADHRKKRKRGIPMARPIVSLTAMTAILALLGACDQPGQTEAQKENKASEQALNARNEAEQRAQNAQVEADKEIAAARADFAKAREDYLHTKRLDLVSLDTKIMNLESKARTLAGKARTDLDARIETILTERDTFVHHMTAIDTNVAATWDSAKANLDKEWDALRSSVDHADN